MKTADEILKNLVDSIDNYNDEEKVKILEPDTNPDLYVKRHVKKWVDAYFEAKNYLNSKQNTVTE